jgi:mannosyl-oligosaccharide alpha-1,2-mannosidase
MSYFRQEHLLLGGATDQYRKMYGKALTAMKRNIFYRPMTKDQKDILFSGNVDSDGKTPLDQLKTQPEAQHLGCFAGGMVGIAAKMFNNEDDLVTAKRLMEGCLWMYESADQGVHPEIIESIPCEDPISCPWDEQKWIGAMSLAYEIEGKPAVEQKQKEVGLPPGIVKAKDKRYILRYNSV